MKSSAKFTAAAFAIALSLTGPVHAQQGSGSHHGHGDRTPSQGAQMRPGMMGPGMMGRGMMGPGMMGSGMMGRGMMGMMGNCPMMGMMMGGSGNSFAEGRIAFLRAELAITKKQKAAFDAYAKAIKDNLQSMLSMRQTMMTMMSAKTPAKRLEAHLSMMESRIASLRKAKPKLETLYGVLTDEQKKKANQLLTGMGCMM